MRDDSIFFQIVPVRSLRTSPICSNSYITMFAKQMYIFYTCVPCCKQCDFVNIQKKIINISQFSLRQQLVDCPLPSNIITAVSITAFVLNSLKLSSVNTI